MRSFLILLFFGTLPFFPAAQSWNDLNEKVLAFANKGENDSALHYGRKALQKAELEFGKKHPNYIKALNILAVVNDLTGDFVTAEPLYLQALNLQKEISGPTHTDYIWAMEQMATIYRDHNDLKMAISYLLQVKEITRQTAGETSGAYAKALEYLAVAYDDHGEYGKAEPLLKLCRDIRKRIFGETNPAYASVLNNLGVLYVHQGRYPEAMSLFKRSLDIQKSLGADTTAQYSVTLNHIASLYCDMGEYEEAELLFLEALGIEEKEFGVMSQEVATSFNNIATYYSDLGDNEKASKYFLMALDINRSILGEGHAEVASILYNLGQLNQRMEEYEKSEKYFKDAIKVREQALGKDHPKYLASLIGLAGLYYSQLRFKEAEELFTMTLDKIKLSLGESHPLYATAINNLALIYTETGKYRESEALLLKVIAISEKSGIENDPNFLNFINNLVIVYRYTGAYQKVEQLLERGLQLSLNKLKRNFSFLSEQDKEKFAGDILLELTHYQGFYYDYHRQKPSIAATAYDIELAIKGMILNTGVEMRQSIQNSGDTIALDYYIQWKLLKSELARQYALPARKRNPGLSDLEYKANDYEKTLTRFSGFFKNAASVGTVKWKTIQQQLKENEVAVEFASFRYRSNKGWTDSILYTALVLRKNDTHPTLVPLCEAKQLDTLLNNPKSTNENFISALYRGLEIKNKQTGVQSMKLFNLVWKPLDHLLAKNDRIYFAPSGILNQLAFAAIPWDSTMLLSDRYQLQQVSSTGVLIKDTVSVSKPPGFVVLFGGIQYTMTEQEMAAATSPQKRDDRITGPVVKPASRGEAWIYLPGTLKEVNAIAASAAKGRLKYTLYEGKKATEEIFKNYSGTSSPAIIHIATHGFFFPDPANEKKKSTNTADQVYRSADNPLNRSGILLAGANRAWNGEAVPKGAEDGILTAYEAGNLYLGSTQLVVLSACETGLGDIKGSEGVFGLQRSFKMAGAEYLMMSLWKVPDAETAEFMEYFYNGYFGGKTIPAAFIATQDYMKKKYPRDPYKWAAFILIK